MDSTTSSPVGEVVAMDVDGLQAIVDQLDHLGFDVFGPEVRDGTIAVRPLRSVDQLPTGRTLASEPGSVRVEPRPDRLRFGWAVGPQTWKPLLHPARHQTLTMSQPTRDAPVAVSIAARPERPLAMFGVRPCELAAISKLDRVLSERPGEPDPTYLARRTDLFVVVVNCNTPASTCFCTSMGTGPHVDGRSSAHDIEITEVVAESSAEPTYVVRPISERGSRLLADLPMTAVSRAVDDDLERVDEQRDEAWRAIRRRLDAERLPGTLQGEFASPRWSEIADRCLACGNCTAVCPTCFCTTTDDIGDLTGVHTERWKSWESCFSLEFSRVGDEPVRSSLTSRYRQWMTHKLDTWHEQFDESGCVGCGRCIAWCPASIDFAIEAQGFVEDATRDEVSP